MEPLLQWQAMSYRMPLIGRWSSDSNVHTPCILTVSSSGRHFDENGNYTDWWTEHTVEEFQKRADCFVNQYSNYTVEGPNGDRLHVNGKLTLGENIADAGGVAAAFAAWKQRQQSIPDEDLPGLDFFSHDQLFFVFYANCESPPPSSHSMYSI